MACVLEIVASFAGRYGTREAAKPAAQARNCSFRRLAQRRLRFAERHFDGVQIWRVLRQIAKDSAARFAVGTRTPVVRLSFS